LRSSKSGPAASAFGTPTSCPRAAGGILRGPNRHGVAAEKLMGTYTHTRPGTRRR